jgi:hypothetical protein
MRENQSLLLLTERRRNALAKLAERRGLPDQSLAFAEA